MAPHILSLCMKRRLEVGLRLRPFHYRKKCPTCQLNRVLSGPHSRTGHFDEKKIHLCYRGK